jgi:hypothetical protein
MADQDQPNMAENVAGFAADATVDTAADGAINTLIDDVANHIPGGGSFDAVIRTGVDLQANNAINAINAEITNLEGMFEHKEG